MTELVAGIARFDDRPVRRNDLASMLAAMCCETRRPQIWTTDHAGLAKAQLAMPTSVDREAEPLCSSAAGAIAASNGLGSRDWSRLINQPDIVQAGAVLPLLDQQLNGMRGPFSGALWHAGTGSMFCFRDPMGASPSYYAHQPGRYFVFASTIAAILAYLRGETTITADRERLEAFLENRPGGMEPTFFAGISRFPPGHIGAAAQDGFRLHRYWHPNLTPLSLPTDAAYRDAFRHLFNQAVERSLPDSGQAGSLLSGGMDSSSIACVAADLLTVTGRPCLKSFTMLFSADDERPYAQAVIAAKNLDPHFLEEDQVRLAEDTAPLIRAIEEPFEHPGFVSTWSLSHAVRDAGVTLLLDGTLGDSVISYDSRFLHELLNRSKFRTFVREGVLFTRRMEGAWSSPFPLLWREGLRPFLIQLLRRKRHPGHLLQFLEATSPSNLRVMEIRSKLAMACGFATRLPFADRDLVEFCVRLPPEQRVRGGWNRYLLRSALTGTLPPQITLRDGKFSSGQTIRRNFAKLLKTGSGEQMLASATRLDSILDVTTVTAAISRLGDDNQPIRFADVTAAWIPFAICCWLDTFGVAL